MKKYNIFFLLIFPFFIVLAKAITLNFSVFGFYVYDDLYSLITEDFNEYSKKNNLDITLNMVLFTEKNTTAERDAYSSTIDSLLKKKSKKYDLYVYDPIYTRRFSTHFIDLSEYVSQEYLDSFSYDSYQTCVYKDKWVGLPIFMKYKILYSNTYYLNKHKKDIPSTWDELIETGEYILEKEKNEDNNTNLIGYNGLFPNDENTMCSLYEFIYSYRDTKESLFPDLTSKTSENALNKIMEIKNKIGSDETFINDVGFAMENVFSSNILFASLWDGIQAPNYTATASPGIKKGITGSCLGGFNIGISKYISNENIKAALKVLQFFTSIEEQEKLAIQFNTISGLTKLYDDKEFCETMDCKLPKDVQGINRPCSLFDDYELYALKVIRIFLKFLYGNDSAKSVLMEIDDISKIYTFSIKTSKLALTIYIILIITLLFSILSSITIFIPNFKQKYQFLSIDLGIVYTLGSLLVIFSVFTYFGELSIYGCFERQITITSGVTLVFLPMLYKLIINFPVMNKTIEYIKNNKFIFIMIVVLFEIFLNSLLLISPYQLDEIILENGKNYNKCSYSTLGMIVTMIQMVEKLILFMVTSLLIFLEWNMKAIYYDTRIIAVIISIDWILFILYIIINTIKINSFYVVYTINTILIMVFSLSNCFYMFIERYMFSHVSSKKEEINMINKLLKFNDENNAHPMSDVISSASYEDKNTTNNSNTFDYNSSYKKKILNYHYATTQTSSINTVENRKSSQVSSNHTTENKQSTEPSNSIV